MGWLNFFRGRVPSPPPPSQLLLETEDEGTRLRELKSKSVNLSRAALLGRRKITPFLLFPMEEQGEKPQQEKQKKAIPSTNPDDYTIIKEGEAEILMHRNNQVFYNKTQVNNRDISIAVLRTFISKRKEEHDSMRSRKVKTVDQLPEDGSSAPADEEATTHKEVTDPHYEKSNGDCEMGVDPPEDEPDCSSKEPVKTPRGKGRGELKAPRILEALAASGLRALRYAREVEGIGQVVAVDNDKGMVVLPLHQANKYERAYPVQSVADGGMLMCTATDMAVLCGGNGEACYSKYGSYPLKGKYCHEMALRILLASIESHANRYKRYIVPILSVQMDFYIRVFVRIFTSASAMKNTPLKLSYVYQCVGCDSFHMQCLGRTVTKNNSVRYLPGFGPVVPQECSNCGKKFNMGGPIWSAPIHDQEWVASILANVKSMKERYPAYDKISAVLTTISEELNDVPLFVSLHNLCATLKCTSPSAVMFRSAVLNAGYRISGSHVNPLGMKTDAPMNVIWDIMRCWVKNHPVKAQPPDQSGSVILAKEPTLQANFARAQASLSKAQAKKVARFLPNPERHWGPKVRAGRQITSKHASLLGPENINGHPPSQQGDEPGAKRQKTDDSAADS
ncbi:hypothetical protein ACLOJK_035905 [Asimina triloba]